MTFRRLINWTRERDPGLSPQSLLIVGFGMLIAIGTLLLALPVCHEGVDVSWLDALFTSTSAVCVTGLVVVDTGGAFSGVGELVILLLIQAGGIGVMAFAALALEAFGRRISLRAQMALNGSYFHADLIAGFRRRLFQILRTVALLEALGAGVLFLAFVRFEPSARAIWLAVFHAVSAFCNAGFSLFADSLMGYRQDLLILGPVMVLILAGGIGLPVLIELHGRFLRRSEPGAMPPRLTLHTRVVLWASAVLVGGGGLLLAVVGSAGGEASTGDRLLSGLFQAVSARTAGFNSVDMAALPLAGLLLLCVLMFVGGSPGSCAGGVKTTTVVIWIAQFTSRLRGRKQTALLGRHIPGEMVRRASTLVGLALLWNLVGTVLLAVTEAHGGWALQDLLFEQLSAFGTVGLSTGVTSHLSVLGRLWIILTMFVGRVGPLTIVVWVFEQRTPGVRLPEGRIMIG